MSNKKNSIVGKDEKIPAKFGFKYLGREETIKNIDTVKILLKAKSKIDTLSVFTIL